MKQSERIDLIAAALVAAQAELPTIAFDATNPHFKNRYASLPQLVSETRAILAKQGLAILQGCSTPDTDEGKLVGFSVDTLIVHKSGQWIQQNVYIPVEKPTAQAAGSALTYGRRYAYAAALNLVSDADDDGETASNHPVRSASQPAPTSENTPPPARRRVSDPGELEMPFGKNKGRKLKELRNMDLESTINWCRDKDAEKFKDLIAACEAVLRGKESAAGFEDPPPPEQDDDLPF